jgi:hypothetical protein
MMDGAMRRLHAAERAAQSVRDASQRVAAVVRRYKV